MPWSQCVYYSEVPLYITVVIFVAGRVKDVGAQQLWAICHSPH